jgi:glutaryl-CoA dehydrogenase
MWITSGSIADVAVIWAKVDRDEDECVRGFLVETDRPGFRAKTCTRQVVAARVGHQRTLAAGRARAGSNLLPGTGGLKSPLMCLNQARYGISWGAIGAAMDCYDTALQYSEDAKAISRSAHCQPSARAGKAGVDGLANQPRRSCSRCTWAG